MKISYESANVDFGINVMESLYQALREKYDELVKYYQDNYDRQIQYVKAEFDILEAESVFYEQRIKSVQKRINELEALTLICLAGRHLAAPCGPGTLRVGPRQGVEMVLKLPAPCGSDHDKVLKWF